MTPIEIEIEPATTQATQRTYARLAGFLFLWLIVTGIAGLALESHIAGSGSFAETAKRITASEHLYRTAICMELIETMSAALLAFALYVILKPIDSLLAQLAMYFRLGESFLGAVGVMFAFLRLHLFIGPQPNAAAIDRSEALADLLGHAGSNISAIFFSIGSALFFYLFFKSRYIPKALSAFGVFASIVVTIMLFAILIFPEHEAALNFGWAPMAIAEVATGLWLMAFAGKTGPLRQL